MTDRIKRSHQDAQILTDDSLIEILSRLPTRSLRRFECVSKGLNKLISLVFSLRKLLLPVTGLLVYPNETNIEQNVSIAPDFPWGDFESRVESLPFYSSFIVIQSCNGLLLFGSPSIYTLQCLYYVWNPATMEIVALPEPPTWKECRSDCSLVYNPCISPHYKVIRFAVLNPREPCILVEIYSSMTGSWASTRVPCEYFVTLRGWIHKPVFHNGAVYFLAQTRKTLIRFDIEKGRFSLVDLLEKARGCGPDVLQCMGESRGHLYYSLHLPEQFKLKIYRLEELDGTWLLTHTMNTKNIIHPRRAGVLAFHPESEVIYLSTTSKNIVSYHPSNGLLEEIQVLDDEDYVDWRRVFFVIPCLESIDPPGDKLVKKIQIHVPRQLFPR